MKSTVTASPVTTLSNTNFIYNSNSLINDNAVKTNSNVTNTDDSDHTIDITIPRSHFSKANDSVFSVNSNNIYDTSMFVITTLVDEINFDNINNLDQCVSSNHSKNNNCQSPNCNEHNHICFRHHHRRNSIAVKFNIHT